MAGALYQLMDSGRLPYVKIGGTRLIKKAEVLALIGRCAVGRTSNPAGGSRNLLHANAVPIEVT